MRISLATGETVGAATSGRMLLMAVACAPSLMGSSGRVAITTEVPRMRVRVTVKVEVEVEVVVASLEGRGAGSCGRAAVKRGRRRMGRERVKCGGRIGAMSARAADSCRVVGFFEGDGDVGTEVVVVEM